MSHPSSEKEDQSISSTDIVEGSNHDEKLHSESEKDDAIEEASSDGDHEPNEKGRELEQTKSYATSAVTRTDSHVDAAQEKKPWYKNINPLRWGKIPAVPTERTVSREYYASFLSLVYFQWMAPMMSVRFPVLHFFRTLELVLLCLVFPSLC